MDPRWLDLDLIHRLAGTNGRVRGGQLKFAFEKKTAQSTAGGEDESDRIQGADQGYVRRIFQALEECDYGAVVAACAELAACGCPISRGMCWELATVLKCIVPQVPNPVLRTDLGPLRPLLDRIWTAAVENGDTDLMRHSGPALYRWYEHQGMYEDARRILTRLVEVHAECGDFGEEAVSRNNLGFEYFLEGRFHEAIRHFETAADLFEEIGDIAQRDNSRANRWNCLFELGETARIGRAEMELEELAESLSQYHLWQARKPLILLARIQEKRGRLRQAAELVRRAIQSAQGSGTRYPETDAEYLKRLEAKLEERRAGRRSRKVRKKSRPVLTSE